MAKKNAFKNKFAMFEKKEGPSEDEVIKQNIQKASQGRRFDKQMKAAMADESMQGMSPMAMEMALRAKIGNTTVKREEAEEVAFEGAGTSTEEWQPEGGEADPEAKQVNAFKLAQDSAAAAAAEVYDAHVTREEEGGGGWGELVAPLDGGALDGGAGAAAAPADDAADWRVITDENGTYWWNTKTDDTTYDKPAALVMAENGGCAWTLVEDPGGNYYWNVLTNDTSYERPADYFAPPAGKVEPPAGGAGAEEAVEDHGAGGGGGEEGEVVMWTEDESSDPPTYFQTENPAVTRPDKPVGAVLLAFPDGTMYQQNEDGSYANTDTGEVVSERPAGATLMVAEVAGPATRAKGWSTHADEHGHAYYYNQESGAAQYEPPSEGE